MPPKVVPSSGTTSNEGISDERAPKSFASTCDDDDDDDPIAYYEEDKEGLEAVAFTDSPDSANNFSEKNTANDRISDTNTQTVFSEFPSESGLHGKATTAETQRQSKPDTVGDVEESLEAEVGAEGQGGHEDLQIAESDHFNFQSAATASAKKITSEAFTDFDELDKTEQVKDSSTKQGVRVPNQAPEDNQTEGAEFIADFDDFQSVHSTHEKAVENSQGLSSFDSDSAGECSQQPGAFTDFDFQVATKESLASEEAESFATFDDFQVSEPAEASKPANIKDGCSKQASQEQSGFTDFDDFQVATSSYEDDSSCSKAFEDFDSFKVGDADQPSSTVDQSTEKGARRESFGDFAEFDEFQAADSDFKVSDEDFGGFDVAGFADFEDFNQVQRGDTPSRSHTYGLISVYQLLICRRKASEADTVDAVVSWQ